MRSKRTDLEALCSEVVCRSAPECLRNAIRELLDHGVKPAEVRKRYGARGPRKHNLTALTVEWLVDEWEREQGHIKPDESIDTIQ